MITFQPASEINVQQILANCEMPTCVRCNTPISMTHWTWTKYPHSDGLQIGSDREKFWYFYECSCGYGNSFPKLSDILNNFHNKEFIPRNYDPTIPDPIGNIR